MANTRSAAKQARKALRRRVLNRKSKDGLRLATKQIRTLVKEGKKEEAVKFFSEFQSIVDKAAKSKGLHRNTANRRKARAAKLLKAAAVEAPAPKAKAAKKK
jgi:small subunit ribosomal protein S20